MNDPHNPFANVPSEPSKINLTMVIVAFLGVLVLCVAGMFALGMGGMYAMRDLNAQATTTSIAYNATIPAGGFHEPPRDWQLVLREDFEADANNWGYPPDETKVIVEHVDNGVFSWVLQPTEPEIWYETPELEDDMFTDFLVSVDVNQVQGSGTFGLTFRGEGGALYFFEVTDYGDYTLNYGDDDGWDDALIEWSDTGIDGDVTPFRLTVRGEGDRFFLFVNDQYVGQYRDPRLTEGRIGIAICTYEGDPMIEVEFDNFMIYAPRD